MANFVDILIDYPNSKIYVEQLFERLQQESILTERQVANYRLHIENVEKQGIDIDMDWTQIQFWRWEEENNTSIIINSGAP